MSITLSIFLFIYFMFLAVWLLFSLVGIFHMLSYGFKNIVTLASVFGYIAVSVVILAVSAGYLLNIDWSLEVLNVVG